MLWHYIAKFGLDGIFTYLWHGNDIIMVCATTCVQFFYNSYLYKGFWQLFYFFNSNCILQMWVADICNSVFLHWMLKLVSNDSVTVVVSNTDGILLVVDVAGITLVAIE